MSLYEDWCLYTKDVQSPQPFVDAAFYFMIGAALQRRVWFGDLDFHAVFPNQYIAFIGPASAGKSLITSPMKELLEIPAEIKTPENDLAAELLGEDASDNRKGARQPLIYIAPNSTTFEQFTQETSRVAYLHRYVDEQNRRKAYHHSSLVFILDELTSIFKKNAEQLSDFLLEAYNGGRKYVRKLKHSDTDFCTNMCISLLGNTTLGKFQSLQNQDILSDGFMARTIIVYGVEKRFHLYSIPPLNEEQKAAKLRLQSYIRELSKLYGPLVLNDEAKEYIHHHFELHPNLVHTNKHPMLDEYYGRKNLHHQKILFAVHFARTTDMVITRQDAEAATEHLAKLEKDMHIPFVGMGRNESAKITEDIWRFIKTSNKSTKKSIFIRFYQSLKTPDELNRVLDDLMTMERITRVRENNIEYYAAKTNN
jgi:hypothetical protein